MMALKDYQRAARALDTLRRDIVEGAHLPSLDGDTLARDLKIRELRRLSSALWYEVERITRAAQAEHERARRVVVSHEVGQQSGGRGA